MSMRVRRTRAAWVAAAIAALGALGASRESLAADDVHRLKLSHFAPAVHHQHAVTFMGWARELAERSDGRLQLDIYPAEQLGKAGQQYNLVRRGDVDIAFFVHGTPAGRFPLTELTHLPLLFKSGEQASRVLMALVPEYLAAEHQGVKILYLFGRSPGVLHMRSRPVHRPEDLRGLRIRQPSAAIGATLRAWGAAPAALPLGDTAPSLAKGVLDGLLIPYADVLAFRLAPHLRYSTEVFSNVETFGVIMNPRSYERLPRDLQQLIDDTTGMEAAREVGARWDAMEPSGKAYLVDSEIEIIELSDEQRALFAAGGQSVIEARLAAAAARGLPAHAFLARVRELAAEL
jgi:TRAP-type C4-dicarboxylate transport system substrate-binding protein